MKHDDMISILERRDQDGDYCELTDIEAKAITTKLEDYKSVFDAFEEMASKMEIIKDLYSDD